MKNTNITATKLNAKVELKYVPLDKITPSSFNPLGRTDDVRTIVKSFQEVGQLEPIHAVNFGNKFVIADGTRRFTAASEAGLLALAVNVYTPNNGPQAADDLLAKLYVELNQHRATLKDKQMLNASLQGGPTFNTRVKAASLLIQELFSEQEIVDILVKNKVAPSCLYTARRMAVFMLDKGIGRDTVTFKNRVRNNILYLVRTPGAQQSAMVYIRKNYSKEAFINAVNNNRPIPRVMIKS